MTKLQKRAPPATAEANLGDEAELGRWYWVTDEEEEWLGCVTHLGSNYVEVSSTVDSSIRIHLDEFYDTCRLEPNASEVIQRNISEKKAEVLRLMKEVEALTARLGVGHTAALPSGASEGHALAKLDANVDVGSYKEALVRAKEKELPALFSEIESANASLARWMKAETLPMRAQLEQMKGAIGRIDARIFNVELYAGLTEQVEQIADGEPAEMTEKVRLMQRRCYMDEECLVEYQTGGMEFRDIRAFDSWLTRPENRDRLLPFPRCIVAFRVRRHEKYREISSFIDFFRAVAEIRADKLTFLYIRNGEQVFRMNTELEFGEQLFPDTNHHWLTAGTKLWAKMFTSTVDHIITDDQYQGLVEEFRRKEAEHKKALKKHRADHRAWKKARKAARAAGKDFDEREPWEPYFFSHDSPKENYQPFETDNIYYDDIQAKIADEIQQYNRIGIIIQGLLDRSPVLHPHPPWKIWSKEGSSQALEFVYDRSRALFGGEKPDFEAYRRRLNESLQTGSITVGQHTAWVIDLAEKETRPRYGNPGPPALARVVKYMPRRERCVYAWNREAESYQNHGKMFRTTFTCDAGRLLNVDAYRPGDFRQFFQDPRTREEYLQWAPLLLEAEEYHAGNRKVPEPPEPVAKTSSWEGRRAYRRRKERQALLDKRVRLVRSITTTGGDEYAAGTLWKVTSNSGGGLTIKQEDGDGWIRNMQPNDLEVVPEKP
jgi:hypothetical protein